MTGKEVAEIVDAAEEPVATVVEHPGGWHSVRFGRWEVSVDPAGLLMLPRHLVDDEVDDFVSAILAAGQVASGKRAVNEDRALNDDRTLAPRVHVRQGGPAPGAARMPITSRAATSGTQMARGRPLRTGAQPAGTQGVPQRPRVPLPPPARRQAPNRNRGGNG